MKEEKINFLQMIIYLSLLGVLGMGFYLLAKTMILQTQKEVSQNDAVSISVQDVEHALKTCPIPFNEWELPEHISSVCDDPILKKQDFTVAPTSLYVVVKNGEKLKLVDIKPSLPTALSYLPESEKETICLAFKDLARQIREKGGFAVAKCDKTPVLRIGVPEKNLPKKPDTSGSGSGSGGSGIALFSLFSLVSIF